MPAGEHDRARAEAQPRPPEVRSRAPVTPAVRRRLQLGRIRVQVEVDVGALVQRPQPLAGAGDRRAEEDLLLEPVERGVSRPLSRRAPSPSGPRCCAGEVEALRRGGPGSSSSRPDRPAGASDPARGARSMGSRARKPRPGGRAAENALAAVLLDGQPVRFDLLESSAKRVRFRRPLSSTPQRPEPASSAAMVRPPVRCPRRRRRSRQLGQVGAERSTIMGRAA